MGEKASELKTAVDQMTSVFESEKGNQQKKVQKNEVYKASYNNAVAWLENINAYTAIPDYGKNLQADLISYAKACLSFIASVPSYVETNDSLKVSDTIAILAADYENIMEEVSFVEILSTPAAEFSYDEILGQWRVNDKRMLVFEEDKIVLGAETYEGVFSSGRFISDKITVIFTEYGKDKIKFIFATQKESSSFEATRIKQAPFAIGDILDDASDFSLQADNIYYTEKLIPSSAQDALGFTYYEPSEPDSTYLIGAFTLKNTGARKLTSDAFADIRFGLSYMNKLNFDATIVVENKEGTGFLGSPELLTAEETKLYARFTVPNSLIQETAVLSVLCGNYIYELEYTPTLTSCEEENDSVEETEENEM